MRSGLLACLIVLLANTVRAQENPDEDFLRGLVGRWDMSGTVQGKPVRYAAVGERILQGGFVRFHMIDTAAPAQYEAHVYLGFDPRQHDYVVHWLDKFGAAGARVVATGRRDGDRLTVLFPYANGAFRNVWTRSPGDGGWALVIEAHEQDGHWSTFADYRITRAR